MFAPYASPSNSTAAARTTAATAAAASAHQPQPHYFLASPPPQTSALSGGPADQLARGQTYTLYRVTQSGPQTLPYEIQLSHPAQQQQQLLMSPNYMPAGDPQWAAWQGATHGMASPSSPSIPASAGPTSREAGRDSVEHSVVSIAYGNPALQRPSVTMLSAEASMATTAAQQQAAYATYVTATDPSTGFTPLFLTGVADSRRTSLSVDASGCGCGANSALYASLREAAAARAPSPPRQQLQQPQRTSMSGGNVPLQHVVAVDSASPHSPLSHSMSLPPHSAYESAINGAEPFLTAFGHAYARTASPNPLSDGSAYAFAPQPQAASMHTVVVEQQPGSGAYAHPTHYLRADGTVQPHPHHHMDVSREVDPHVFLSAYSRPATSRHSSLTTSTNSTTIDPMRPFASHWEATNASVSVLNEFSARPSFTSLQQPQQQQLQSTQWATRASLTSTNSAAMANSLNEGQHRRISGAEWAAYERSLTRLAEKDQMTLQQQHQQQHKQLHPFQQICTQQIQQDLSAANIAQVQENETAPVSPPPTPSRAIARRNRDKAVLFVGQLNYEATEADVAQVFSCYGTPLSVVVLKDKGKSSRRGGGAGGARAGGTAAQRKVGGSAFVTYSSTLEADTAIMALHGRYNAKDDDPDNDDEAKFLQVSYGQQTGLISSFGAMHAKKLHASKPENPIPRIVLEGEQGGEQADAAAVQPTSGA